MENKDSMKWHPLTEHYQNECSDMTDTDTVINLLLAYSMRDKYHDSQLGVLLHNAAMIIENNQDSMNKATKELLSLHSVLQGILKKTPDA
jgi:hypothetical protein